MHNERGVPAKEPWSLSQAALGEQLGNSITGPNQRGMKAGHHQDEEQKRQGQHDFEMPFMRMIRHHGHSPLEKKWQYVCRLIGMSALKEGGV